jgi:hypothetical protein
MYVCLEFTGLYRTLVYSGVSLYIFKRFLPGNLSCIEIILLKNVLKHHCQLLTFLVGLFYPPPPHPHFTCVKNNAPYNTENKQYEAVSISYCQKCFITASYLLTLSYFLKLFLLKQQTI